MIINKITIDKQHFIDDIESELIKNNVKRNNVINITQDRYFTILWYWDY